MSAAVAVIAKSKNHPGKRKGHRRMAVTEVAARYLAIQYDGTNGQEVADAFGLPLSSDTGTYMEMETGWVFGSHHVNLGEWIVWRDFGTHKDLQGILTDAAYQAAFAPVAAGP